MSTDLLLIYCLVAVAVMVWPFPAHYIAQETDDETRLEWHVYGATGGALSIMKRMETVRPLEYHGRKLSCLSVRPFGGGMWQVVAEYA